MIQMKLSLEEKRSAIFANDRRHRALLRIVWDENKTLVAFVGLNPSTADEFADDPTIRRVKGFASRWGYGGILMVNLFAFRATDPRALLSAEDPIGPWEDVGRQLAFHNPSTVVACWGAHGKLLNRGAIVAAQISRHFGGSRFMCFGKNADGSPKHPLYLRSDASLVPYQERAA